MIEDEVANAGEIRGRTAAAHRLGEVRALARMMQIERRRLNDRGADVIVDVLAEEANRGIAAVAVVPLQRQIEVLRFERFQRGVALRASAAVDAHELIERLPALNVAPARPADRLAVAGTDLH